MNATAAAAHAGGLPPGYADPVVGAQATFRAALHALSRPGTIVRAAAPQGLPPGLSPAMTALLLTLADGDTPIWLPPQASEAARNYVRFHCGSPIVADAARARFIAVPAGAAMPALGDCPQGDPAYPDRSATLLVEVRSLGTGRPVALRGPGIASVARLAVDGLPDDFWAQWRANHDRFPLGVDVLLMHGDQLCGLPRTTVVED